MRKFQTDDLMAWATAAHRREQALIGALSEHEVRAPSTLPEWSRGHVIAARIVFTRAAVRQIAHAIVGREIDLFDGGREGRDAQIEELVARPAHELISGLRDEVTALEQALADLTPEQWLLQVTYRDDNDVRDLAWGSWRECELHLVDLDVGALPSGWSDEFCVGLFRFLTPRVPDGTKLILRTPDGREWALGAGRPLTVSAPLTDLAAWMAGRRPLGPLTSSTGELPTLQRLRGDGRRKATTEPVRPTL